MPGYASQCHMRSFKLNVWMMILRKYSFSECRGGLCQLLNQHLQPGSGHSLYILGRGGRAVLVSDNLSLWMKDLRIASPENISKKGDSLILSFNLFIYCLFWQIDWSPGDSPFLQLLTGQVSNGETEREHQQLCQDREPDLWHPRCRQENHHPEREERTRGLRDKFGSWSEVGGSDIS